MNPIALIAVVASLSFAETKPLRVLSYNVAGVPIVHPKINQRIKAIGELLAKGEYDVIAVQELWLDRHAERLYRAAGLPNRARAPQRWLFGDGLMILSRYPIRETKWLSFSKRTEHRFRLDGEQFAHKGALLARIETPSGEIDVIDTHFVADYKSHKNTSVRAQQARQLVEWAAPLVAGRRVVLAGDLNAPPEDPIVVELRAGLALVDPCDGNCATSSNNRRIDYVLVSSNGPKAIEAKIALNESILVGGKSFRVSDHLAVFTVFQ
ncbi:MAG: endonuclease/exonuclease/phosphatase family protein [Elusimicrobia bacterium]|nr:endonuclease/exonuclease/phosphatase family protein [Elusimicrobiota bacterium]